MTEFSSKKHTDSCSKMNTEHKMHVNGQTIITTNAEKTLRPLVPKSLGSDIQEIIS